MILLIDNYDSFSYNLYQLVGEVLDEIGPAEGEHADNSIEALLMVIRNDEMTVEEVAALEPEAIILSPGPGRPADAGICEAVVAELGSTTPILGVCLGHQAIVEATGGVVGYAKQLMHGKESPCRVEADSVLFTGLPEIITVGRYHSLAAEGETLPAQLRVTAFTEDGEVMAVEDATRPVFGVQFHPESIMTPDGKAILANFLAFARGFDAGEASG